MSRAGADPGNIRRPGTGWPVVGITPAGRRFCFPTVTVATQVLHCSDSALRKTLTPNAVRRSEGLGCWHFAYLKNIPEGLRDGIRSYIDMTDEDRETFVLCARMRPNRKRAQDADEARALRVKLDGPARHGALWLRAGIDHFEKDSILKGRAAAEEERRLRQGEPGAVYRYGYMAEGFPMSCPVCGRIIVPESGTANLTHHWEDCTTASDVPAWRIHRFGDGIIRLRVDGWTLPPREGATIPANKCLGCPHFSTNTGDCTAATTCPHRRDKRGSWAYYNHLGKDDANEQIHR